MYLHSEFDPDTKQIPQIYLFYHPTILIHTETQSTGVYGHLNPAGDFCPWRETEDAAQN